jgi:hypothetical protein
VSPYGLAEASGTLDVLHGVLAEEFPESRDGHHRLAPVEGDLGGPEHDTSTEILKPTGQRDRAAERLLDRLAGAPALGVVQVLVVAPLEVVLEVDGRFPDVDDVR